jgi:hypothetical protein
MLSDGSLIIGSGLLIALAAHNTQVALRPTSPADEACARFSNCQSAAPLTRPGGRLSLSILLIWHFSLGNALWRFGLNPGDMCIHGIILDDASAATVCFSLCFSRHLRDQVIGVIPIVQ